MKKLPIDAKYLSKTGSASSQDEKQSIAIIVSNDEMPSNGDAIYTFKQNMICTGWAGLHRKTAWLYYFRIIPIQSTGGTCFSSPKWIERKMGWEKTKGKWSKGSKRYQNHCLAWHIGRIITTLDPPGRHDLPGQQWKWPESEFAADEGLSLYRRNEIAVPIALLWAGRKDL